MDNAAQDDKTRYIRIAAITALAGNGFLAAIKIIAGIAAGSSALLGDGIDSSADVLIAAATLAVVRIIAIPADENHPWGHRRAETVTVIALSFVLFFAGAQLIIRSCSELLSPAPKEIPTAFAMVAALISVAGKGALAYSQFALGRRSGSAMVRANAKNMLGDVVLSSGVIVGLVISTATGSGIADVILAALVGLWVIKTAFGIFREANLELMDGSPGKDQYKAVFSAVKEVDGASNPHRARMRRIGGFWDITIDIEVDPNLTVSEAHAIASRVENQIKRSLENVFDIIVHIEPKGDVSDEGFGLSDGDG